ncbi:MAG TPA: hypothetical protein VFN13_00785 [Rudaea sp.]|nr:hypothetical protein [Rudaea sp.]
MNRISQRSLFVLTLTGALALGACGKHAAPPPETTPPPPPAATPAPAPAPVAPTPAATPAAAPAAETSVTSVQMGNSVDPTGMIASPTMTFSPKDVIYAVVQTNSTGNAQSTITAKWTFGDGQLVNSSEHKIAASGPAHTSFHINKPDGFPAGKYTLEISVDGKVANTTSFEVK